MIQRIQTVYLAIVLVLCAVLFSGSFFRCTDETGQVIKLMLSGNLTDKAGQSFAKVGPLWPAMVIIGLTALATLITILLYSNRKLQMMTSVSVIVLSFALIGAIALYAIKVNHSYKLMIHPGVSEAAALLALVFSVLAYLAIRRDERLVRSYDRLR
jgi:hypothetical protein